MLKKILNPIILLLLKLRRKLSDNNYIMVVSLVIGILAGLAAVVLKNLVHGIEFLLQFWFRKEYANVPYFFYPVLGILLTTTYVKIFHKEKFEKGLSNLIRLLSINKANLEFHKQYSHVFTSALTVGFGGSVGLEAPIVTTGSAIGSNLGNLLKLSKREQTLLIGCGAAAGIAGVFNSPIAGVIFVMEVLMIEYSIPAFIPLLISSATGAVISKALLSTTLLNFKTQGWEFTGIPFYFLLGLVCAFVSLYLINTTLFVEDKFRRFNSQYRKALFGGLLLGLLIFLFPPLYGEGFETISYIFSGHSSDLMDKSFFYLFKDSPFAVIGFCVALIVLKVFASSITIASGGNGGIIAPSLFIGAIVGFLFVYILELIGLVNLRIENFIAAGMVGVLSATINAPLSAIFLIAEGTGGYSLIVPLMIVSAISYGIKRFYEPYSIYTKLLAEKGQWSEDNTDTKILSNININELIENDFLKVLPNETLGELTDKISTTHKDIFVVVDKEDMFIAVVNLDDVREFLFTPEVYEALIISDVMHNPKDTIDVNEEIEQIMSKFEKIESEFLPLLEDGKYKGFISKSKLLTKYREQLLGG